MFGKKSDEHVREAMRLIVYYVWKLHTDTVLIKLVRPGIIGLYPPHPYDQEARIFPHSSLLVLVSDHVMVA